MRAFRAEGLAFGYDGRPLFRSFELDVPTGDCLAIIGPNGAGKTTLLRLLAGLLTPGAGRVLVGGRDSRRTGRAEMARLVAVVPQHSRFTFEYTVEEVVMMGRNPWLGRFRPAGPEDRRHVEEALAAMDLSSLREARISEVSGGERQRVVIARALAQATPAVLFDEPGSHLDLAHLSRLGGLLAALAGQGRTVIFVSHDVNFAAAHGRRLLVLKEGRGVALGPPAEVLTEELVASVYGVRPTFARHPETGRPVLLLPGPRAESGSGTSSCGRKPSPDSTAGAGSGGATGDCSDITSTA